MNRRKASPLLYSLMDGNTPSCSVFRYQLLKCLMTGKGVEGDGSYREKGVKYFEDRKVGNRSELHFIKRKDTKKSGFI